jgi:Spy/CpxP family protein refolding chaperone
MKLAICFLFIATMGVAQAQQPGPDPVGENLFPPEIIMQHQQAIGLTQEQRDSLKAELRKTQTQFTELQWQLQDETEKLVELIKPQQVDEALVLAQLDKVLNAEREIKRAQIALLVRIKNKLTAEQQAKLQEIMGKRRPR